MIRDGCAEDNPDIAAVMKTGLCHAGHFVECVADGAEALERIKAQPDFFDVLITDHRMPRATGLMLVRSLRDSGFVGWIIVHCSGLTERDAAAYKVLAVERLFDKPSQSAELLRIVLSFTRAKANGCMATTNELLELATGDESGWERLHELCQNRANAELLAQGLAARATIADEWARSWASVLEELHPGLKVRLPRAL